MTNADKMFEELGYKKVKDSKLEVVYKDEETLLGDKFCITIAFYKISKRVQTYDEKNKSLAVTIPELKAINQKCKELGWLDD